VSGFTRRNYSSNVAFNPLDYRFLKTFTNSINVQVTTNNIPAICNGSCAYAFNTYSEITFLAYSGSVLSLSLSNPTSLNFTTSSITVSVQGQPCPLIPSSTLASLSCYLQNNTDNSPILIAGDLTPIVSIPTYGIAGLASNVSALSIPLVVSSLSLSSGGNNGGILVSVLGQGFPLQKSLITITVCGNNATINSISNIQAQFYLPACGSTGPQLVTVTVGSSTNSSLTFNYIDGSSVAPTITFINPTSANPGLKGTIQINGEKFGNDSSIATVFLSNATGKIYQLPILSMNDTFILAGLPGGNEGDFTL
jgi:hypothetical protein